MNLKPFHLATLLAASSILLALVPPAGAGASLGVVCVGDAIEGDTRCVSANVADTLTSCTGSCDYDYALSVSVPAQTCFHIAATIGYMSSTPTLRYFQDCNTGQATQDFTYSWTELGSGGMVDLTLTANVRFSADTVSTTWTHYATASDAGNAEAWLWHTYVGGEFWSRVWTADFFAPVGIAA